jgi:PAS domain-containing protein
MSQRNMDEIWITTDAAGFVMGCSPAALQMLGYTARGARGRELPNMFIRERPRLAELLQAAQGQVIEREADFRPNDRKAIRVRFRLALGERLSGGAATLLWTFDVRWPVGMRLPQGVDRRQLITLWRTDSLKCVFVPGGSDKRRLFVCSANDEVILEEPIVDVTTARARAAELQKLASEGALPSQ